MAKKLIVTHAFRFVFIIGFLSLLGDMTYEGSRSINVALLGSLGSSGKFVGFIGGLGELIGYGLRSLTGFFADKTHKYWAFAFFWLCYQSFCCTLACSCGELASCSNVNCY